MSLQVTAEQVAALEPDEPVHDLFTALHEGSKDEVSDESVKSSTKVLMAGTDNGPPGYPNNPDGHGAADDALRADPRVNTPPLTREQITEINRVTDQTLHTPIIATTPEALALESACMVTLAERTRIEQREKALEDYIRSLPSSSRSRRLLFPNSNL